MEKVVAALILLLELLGLHPQTLLDERLNEAIQDLQILLVLLGVQEVFERPSTGNVVHMLLDLLERHGKVVVPMFDGVHALPKEEIGCRVECHAVEKVRDVDGCTIAWDQGHHPLDVPLEYMQVRDAVFGELRADQLSGGGPFLAVGGEDAVSQEVLPLRVTI